MTRQESLNQILREKIERKIDSANNASRATLDRIERDGNLLVDYLTPLGKNGTRNPLRFASGAARNKTQVILNYPSVETKEFDIHPHAAAQFGDKLGIPSSYLKSLVAGTEPWEWHLAAQILNEHAEHSARQRVLLRAVGDEVRGVLSDMYRRLSTPLIYGSFIQTATQKGARLIDAYYDDTRSWLEFLHPQLLELRGVDEYLTQVAFGLRIASSDFGDGALEVRLFYLQAICLNGAVAQNLMRQIHLGSRISDEEVISNRTFKLDTETQASAVKDIVTYHLDPIRLRSYGTRLEAAMRKMVDAGEEVKRLPKIGLTQGETESVVKILTNGRPEDGVAGPSTLWRLSQGISRVATDSEPRRRRELQEIAGGLLESISKN